VQHAQKSAEDHAADNANTMRASQRTHSKQAEVREAQRPLWLRRKAAGDRRQQNSGRTNAGDDGAL
jgi:hypothetical protein